MRVVTIEAIERRLAEADPNALLRELATTDALLTRPAGAARVALISYRQESSSNSAAATADAEPDLTLDGEALLSAVAAAKRGGIDAVWLDAWCYRFAGEYDHEDFCETLGAVLTSIKAVVWLRRSKAAASGTYGYRLWCTFEAACVEELGLPVLVAGHGLSRRQKALATFGSFAASTGCLGGDGVTDQLCVANFIFYVYVVLLCIFTGAWYAAGIYTKAAETIATVLVIAFYLVLWLAFRSMGSLGQQRRLAQNARRVMLTMLRSGGAGAATGMLSLQCNLPWLPAYDRRDAVVIHETLVRLAPEGERGRVRAAGSALAFSAYAAAACAPGPGDGSARDTSLGEWLRERWIATGVLANGKSTRTSMDSEAAATPFELPIAELGRLGWRRLRGAASCCALKLPTGFYIATRPPERSERGELWAVNTGAIELLPSHTMHRMWVPITLASVARFLLMIVWAILIGTRAVDVGEDVSYEASSVTRWVDGGTLAFPAAVFILSYAWTVRNDHPRLRCGRAPVPVASFSSRALNWLAVAVLIGLFIALPAVRLTGGVDDVFSWTFLLAAAILSYDGVAFVWYVNQQQRHYAPPSQVVVAGDAGFTLAAAALAANAAAGPGVGGADRPPHRDRDPPSSSPDAASTPPAKEQDKVDQHSATREVRVPTPALLTVV